MPQYSDSLSRVVSLKSSSRPIKDQVQSTLDSAFHRLIFHYRDVVILTILVIASGDILDIVHFRAMYPR